MEERVLELVGKNPSLENFPSIVSDLYAESGLDPWTATSEDYEKLPPQLRYKLLQELEIVEGSWRSAFNEKFSTPEENAALFYMEKHPELAETFTGFDFSPYADPGNRKALKRPIVPENLSWWDEWWQPNVTAYKKEANRYKTETEAYLEEQWKRHPRGDETRWTRAQELMEDWDGVKGRHPDGLPVDLYDGTLSSYALYVENQRQLNTARNTLRSLQEPSSNIGDPQ